MGGTEGLVLQRRDRQLLEALQTMRVIDRDQAMKVAGFRSITRGNARLLRLKEAGLLRRLFLWSRAGKALYVLSTKGAAVVGEQVWHHHRRRDDSVVIDPFIEHQLAVNAFRILICYEPLPMPIIRMKRWTVFQEPIATSVPLAPDGYFEIQSAEDTYPMFLEVDRGTEGQKIWKKKTESYLRLALSGLFAKLFGHGRFRVLVVANSERRLDSIRTTVANQTDKIFWFATFESINRESFWSSVWVRPTGTQKQSLL